MDPASVVVVVPVKPLAVAKSRLRDTFGSEERMSLCRELLRRVLKAAQGVDLSEVWGMGGDPDVHRIAQANGAIWMPEEVAGLNETMEIAFRKARDAGKAPLYLPADLPFVQPEDLRRLVQSAGNLTDIVLAPDRLGTGTNAILLAGAAPFRPALGAGSFQRHLAQVASLGMRPSICYSQGLSWDLDTPADMAIYEARSPGLTAELTGQPANGLLKKPFGPFSAGLPHPSGEGWPR